MNTNDNSADKAAIKNALQALNNICNKSKN